MSKQLNRMLCLITMVVVAVLAVVGIFAAVEIISYSWEKSIYTSRCLCPPIGWQIAGLICGVTLSLIFLIAFCSLIKYYLRITQAAVENRAHTEAISIMSNNDGDKQCLRMLLLITMVVVVVLVVVGIFAAVESTRDTSESCHCPSNGWQITGIICGVTLLLIFLFAICILIIYYLRITQAPVENRAHTEAISMMSNNEGNKQCSRILCLIIMVVVAVLVVVGIFAAVESTRDTSNEETYTAWQITGIICGVTLLLIFLIGFCMLIKYYVHITKAPVETCAPTEAITMISNNEGDN